jgi:hypothetical protein
MTSAVLARLAKFMSVDFFMMPGIPSSMKVRSVR